MIKEKTTYYLRAKQQIFFTSKKPNSAAVVDGISNGLVHGHYVGIENNELEFLNKFLCMEHEFFKIFKRKI